MKINDFEDYIRELIEITVRVVDEASGSFTVNGCDNLAPYELKLFVLEL